MKIISVKQPWAWLLLHGKDTENRDWPCSYRGPLGIHASQGMTRMDYEDAFEFVLRFDPVLAARIPPYRPLTERQKRQDDVRKILPGIDVPVPEELVFGAIIGTVNMVGCVSKSPSCWFQGRYGFVFEDAKLLSEPIPAKGSLGLWEWPGRL
jgi:hypothetical protein